MQVVGYLIDNRVCFLLLQWRYIDKFCDSIGPGTDHWSTVGERNVELVLWNWKTGVTVHPLLVEHVHLCMI